MKLRKFSKDAQFVIDVINHSPDFSTGSPAQVTRVAGQTISGFLHKAEADFAKKLITGKEFRKTRSEVSFFYYPSYVNQFEDINLTGTNDPVAIEIKRATITKRFFTALKDGSAIFNPSIVMWALSCGLIILSDKEIEYLIEQKKQRNSEKGE